ncbi:MAG: response regulator [Deltaproteobacteria bacterium]|nr:response regulator [Deltaproteobacteria bacterium]
MRRPLVLIVEDESVVAMDIKEALLSLNYDVSGRAASAAEADELLQQKKPDLVLMDIYLEGEVDGIAAAAKIKEEYDVPVVFLTAYADKSTLDRAKVIEPYGYVLKPFRQTELRTVIELALHKHRSEQERAQAGPVEAVDERPRIEVPDFRSLVKSAHQPSHAMQVTIKNFLESIAPISDLSEEVLQGIASVCAVQSYPAHAVIVHEGAERKEGFIVMSGRVAVYKTSAGGKELVVELLGAADLFGFLTVLEKARFPFSARTQTVTRVLWVPREVIFYITDNYSEISRELFHRVLERLRKAHDLSRSLAHDKVEVRVASALCAMLQTLAEHSNGKSASPEFEMTRQELGELVGTTPETISRILNRMEDEGMVDLSNSGKVRIVDSKSLEEMLKNSMRGGK